VAAHGLWFHEVVWGEDWPKSAIIAHPANYAELSIIEALGKNSQPLNINRLIIMV